MKLFEWFTLNGTSSSYGGSPLVVVTMFATVSLTIAIGLRQLAARDTLYESGSKRRRFEISLANKQAIEQASMLIHHNILKIDKTSANSIEMVVRPNYSVPNFMVHPLPSRPANDPEFQICTFSLAAAKTDVSALPTGFADCNNPGAYPVMRTNIQILDLVQESGIYNIYFEARTLDMKSNSRYVERMSARIPYTPADPVAPPTATDPGVCRFQNPNYVEWASFGNLQTVAAFLQPNPNLPPSDPNYPNYPIGFGLWVNVREPHRAHDFSGPFINRHSEDAARKDLLGIRSFAMLSTAKVPNACNLKAFVNHPEFCAAVNTPQPNTASFFYRPYLVNGGSWLRIGIKNWDSASCTWEVFSARESGCFAAGTKIRLANGTEKPVENLTYEDDVLNPITGKSHNIVRLVAGPESKPLIAIETELGRIVVTETHPMVTTTGVYQAKAVRTGWRVRAAGSSPTSVLVKSVAKVVPDLNLAPPKVYNLELGGSDSFDDHYVLANGIVTGDLFVQERLEKVHEP